MTFEEYKDRFGINGDVNIIEDAHFGIVNGHITTNVLHSNALSFRGLYAPPFASSNFTFDGWICGETVKTQHYSWLPFQVRRSGRVAEIEVESTFTLVSGERAFLLEIKLTNTSLEHKTVPLHFDIQTVSGCL